MNEQEKEVAKHFLKMCVNTAKFSKHYLELMRAVKLRLEAEKLQKTLEQS